jgi:TolB-like protein/tetratricopeptide (TPR) repeat protein
MTQEIGSTNSTPPPVDRLAQLWRRINEHKMVQWCVAYIAVAYAVQHAVVLTGEAFEWPPAVLRITMLLMVLGLPVMLTLAWYHGERASRHFSTAELSILSTLLVIGSVVFYAFVQPNSEVAAEKALPAQQDGVEKARAAAASPRTGISVAVLPFANLSADPEQEFFSAGMTEEITAVLAKIPDLRVVARTSAFQFKDQNHDIQAIAQALKATHLIEGSVRRAGTRLRITAQLINADNGASIWAETYDREFSDVFGIQEDIARAIAQSLRMPLSLSQLVSSRTSDIGIYEQYLRAKISYNARAPGWPEEVQAIIARDPSFAPGWSLWAQGNISGLAAATRGGSLIARSDNFRRFVRLPLGRGALSEEEARLAVATLLDNGEVAARKAIELDPSLPSAYAALGDVQARRENWLEAERIVLLALERDPDNPEALNAYDSILASAGRLNDALPIGVQLRTLEPFVANYNIGIANTMRFAGQTSAGIALLEEVTASGGVNYNRNVFLATAYAAQSQYAKAADTLLLIQAQVPREAVEQAAQILRSAPAKVSNPAALPAINNEMNFVYAHVGAMDRVMEYYEYGLRIGNVQGAGRLWDPVYAPLRKTDRFKTFVRDFGLVDYWRTRGWPDLCRPVGADDFVCD